MLDVAKLIDASEVYWSEKNCAVVVLCCSSERDGNVKFPNTALNAKP